MINTKTPDAFATPIELGSNAIQFANLCVRHPVLIDLYKKDATIHAWFATFQKIPDCNLEEVLIGIIVGLQCEKEAYFNMVIKLETEKTAS